MSQIFLLSPANCGGRRASMVMSERATFDFAAQLRTREGAPLGDVFAFLSGLYFRGKLAYARAFARPPDPESPISGAGSFVITPNAGLRSIDTLVTSMRCATSRASTSPSTTRGTANLSSAAPAPSRGHRPGVPRRFCSAASRRPSTSTSCRTSLVSGCSFPPTSSAAAT